MATQEAPKGERVYDHLVACRSKGCGVGVVVVVLVLAMCGSARGEEREEAGHVPEVHLYTMGVGEALFERFGHAAMCLHHPRRADADLCFNYGTADFRTPLPLSWAFLRGRADFWVATTTPAVMLAHYRTLDRTVWRQSLVLTEEGSLAIARKLYLDARPENRHFTYHHFNDNCTTRLRGVIDEAMNGALADGTSDHVDYTYRDVVRRGFAEEGWLLAVTDLFLGREADETPTRWQAMFLPEELREEVRRRFRAEPVVVYQRRGREISTERPGRAGRLLFLLFGALLAVPILLTRRRERLGVVGPAAILGVVGLVMWSIAILSPLPELRWNEALLVLFPLDLALPLFSTRWRVRYARARLVELGLFLCLHGLGVLRQPLWALSIAVATPFAALCLPKSSTTEGRG